ncbi:MAG: hypothetical protein IPL46_08705 [Saprospiraceae bacterium]|nr:hypothetical protein [Saprospiraceae bacterium]
MTVRNITTEDIVFNKNMKLWSTLTIMVFALSVYSQADQGIGQWKSYLPYRFGGSVTQSPEAVFYGTEWSLLKINKEDLSLEYFSKVEGLHDIGIQSIEYGDDDQVLVVVYTNSNLDLVFEDEIINLNQIQANTQIVGDRTVYDLFIRSPYAYLACGFGVVQLDLQNSEFGFTTFTNTAVRGIVELNNRLVITTDNGVYEVGANEGNNLADFGTWSKLGFRDGLPEQHRGTAIEVIQNTILVGIDDDLYRKTGDRYEFLHREEGFDFEFAVEGAEGILTGWRCRTGCNGKKVLLESGGTKKTINNCSVKSIDAIKDEQGRIWYADEGKGYKYSIGFGGECQTIEPDRPPTHNAAQLATYQKKLYVATGGVTINYGYLFREEGFYTNEDGDWLSYNKNNVEVLKRKDMRDFLCIEISKAGIVYVGTFWDGLIQYMNGEFTVFDASNSSLQNSVINPDRNRITDLSFDADGNLWILNHDAPKPISVFTSTGEWMSFSLPTSTNPEHIVVDNLGYKWISVGGSGLVVYDSGEDLLSTADDRYRLFNSNNSGLTVNSINDLGADRDGGVWVGSTEGVVFFNCSDFPFEANCLGSRPIVDQNGIPGELLGEENIKAIAIDGANQKWFGTNNGVFVQSADIETQIHAFNIKIRPCLTTASSILSSMSWMVRSLLRRIKVYSLIGATPLLEGFIINAISRFSQTR